MPQSPERKREYMRDYMRRKHGFAPRAEGKRDSKGEFSPPREGDFSPFTPTMLRYEAWDNETGEYLGERRAWVTERSLVGLRPLSRDQLTQYHNYIATLGLVLNDGVPGYKFSPLVPANSVLDALRRKDAAQDARIVQMETDLARLKLMMDSLLREGDLAWPR